VLCLDVLVGNYTCVILLSAIG